MACFSVIGLNTATIDNTTGVQGRDTSSNQLIAFASSVIYSGESGDPTVGSLGGGSFIGISRPGSGVSTLQTPEQCNTRSPTPPNDGTGRVQSASQVNISLSYNAVLIVAWRGDYRRQFSIIGDGTTSSEAIWSNSSGAQNTNICDNTLVWSDLPLRHPATADAIKLRRSRSAYFALSSDDCALHKKTGSGAFELTSRPQSLNSGLTWIDRRAWQLGNDTFGSVWLALFSGPPPPVIKYWPWFIAQRT